MKIDLAMDYGEGLPSSPVSDRAHYPSFHYSGDQSLDLPDEGTMLIHFRKTSSGMSERDGVKRYDCAVEVKHILKVKAEESEAPTKNYSRGSEDALDALMEKKMKDSKSDSY